MGKLATILFSKQPTEIHPKEGTTAKVQLPQAEITTEEGTAS